MFAIYKRELRAYFTTAVGYVFLAVIVALSAVAFSLTTILQATNDVTTYFTVLLFILSELDHQLFGSFSGTFWYYPVMFVVMALAMTLLEYIVGVVSFKGFHLRLWDYSKQWGNIQGLICPKFSLAWAILGAAYYFLIHPRILHAIDWLSRNLAFSFVIGLFYGVFLIDVVYSTKLIHRIKKLADENEVIVKYENLKAHVRSVHDRSAQKASFFFPLRSERPLNEHLRELRETLEQRRRTGGKKHA